MSAFDDNALVSIIVPIYNVEEYLPTCIDSIIGQTYSNLEIILIDDGSTDNSYKICDTYAQKDSRIIVIHQKNSGVSDARNKGLDTMTGEYICFIDSDDWIEPNYIESMTKYANKDTIVHCGHYIHKSENVAKICSKSILTFNNYKVAKKYIELFKASNDILGCGMWLKCFPKKTFENLRFPSQHNFEDLYMNFELIITVPNYVIINECLYHYIIRTSSISNTDSCQKQIQHLEAHLQQEKNILKVFPHYNHVKRITFNHCAGVLTSAYENNSDYPEIFWNTMKTTLEQKYKELENHSLKERVKYYTLQYAPNLFIRLRKIYRGYFRI